MIGHGGGGGGGGGSCKPGCYNCITRDKFKRSLAGRGGERLSSPVFQGEVNVWEGHWFAPMPRKYL